MTRITVVDSTRSNGVGFRDPWHHALLQSRAGFEPRGCDV
jgi:hypothetical protein